MGARFLGMFLLKPQVAITMLVLLQAAEPTFPPSTTLSNGSSYDYVIVGGGTAGCVVATRLAEDKRFKVLLIEAGDDPNSETKNSSMMPYTKSTPTDWNYTAENDGYTQQCHIDKVLYLGLNRMLGGTSEQVYMAYSRGHVLDYDRWSHITKDSTWKWPNVLPYFVKLENLSDTEILNSAHKVYHGTEGPMHVIKDKTEITKEYLQAFKQAGHDITLDVDGCTLGYSPALITPYSKKRKGSADAYLTRVKDNTYLTVAKNSLATKILFDNNKNANAVEVINDRDETVIVEATKEIIVTAGAVKSSQILMLSGIGPKDHLEQLEIEVVVDLPEVGKNFQDHLAVLIAYRTNKPPRSCFPSEYPTPLFIGHVALNKCNEYPDYQAINFVATDKDFVNALCSGFKYNSEVCQSLYNDVMHSEILTSFISNMNMKSRGEISLRSANPKDQPKIVTGFLSVDEDLDALIDYLVDYMKVENTKIFKKINATMIDPTSTRCNKFKRGSRKYWRCYTLCVMTALGHYSGTCAMGPVVDGRLRVRGVQRLRVADASVMPFIVRGNTQFPVLMIAEKVSQWLIKDCEVVLH